MFRRKRDPRDPAPLERSNGPQFIEVKNGTEVELYVVLVPVSPVSEKMSRVVTTGHIAFGATGVGSDTDNAVKSYMLPEGLATDEVFLAPGGKFQFLPPLMSREGKLLVATIWEEQRAGSLVKVAILHGKFNTPQGWQRVILPSCLQSSKNRISATLGPGDNPLNMVMIMAGLGSTTTSDAPPPKSDNKLYRATHSSTATRSTAPLSMIAERVTDENTTARSSLLAASKARNIDFFKSVISSLTDHLTSEQVHGLLMTKDALGRSLLETVKDSGDADFNRAVDACLADALGSEQLQGGAAEQLEAYTPRKGAEEEDEASPRQACPPAPFVLASRVDPGQSVHESKQHGFRLTVQDGSLDRAIGPITIQDFAQVVKGEIDGQDYLVNTVVDCQPSGTKFPDKPLLMDFIVEDTSSTTISETYQVLVRKEGAEGWRKVKSEVHVDEWGTYMRAAVSDFCRFTWGRCIHRNDPAPLEHSKLKGVIEVQNGTTVELFLVLVPVSFDSENMSHVAYTGNIGLSAAGVAFEVGGGSDREGAVKRLMLPAGFTPDHISLAEGGTVPLLPPSQSAEGKLLVATISKETHAGLSETFVVLHTIINTPVGKRRVILPSCLEGKSRVYAKLGPDDAPVNMVMIMAGLGSKATSTTLPPTPDGTLRTAANPRTASAAPLSTVGTPPVSPPAATPSRSGTTPSCKIS